MSITERFEALLDTPLGAVLSVLLALWFGAFGIWMFMISNDREY